MKTLRTFIKITSAVLLICLAFTMASCSLLRGSLELKSFTVDRSSIKTVYYVGEQIDFSGIKATVKYSDEDLNTEYTFADLTITYADDITATPGTKSVKVSFMDPHLDKEQSTTVQITVKEDPNAVKHVSYSIDSTDVKSLYNIGDTVDFSAIKVYEHFSDGSKVEITDLTKLTYSVSLDTLTETAGSKSVKVSYDGEDAGAVTVKVVDPEEEKNHVTGLTVGGQFKTDYEVGETVDLTGLTVTVTYEEGETMLVTHDKLTAENVDMSTAGSKTVVISFNDPINNETEYVSIKITVVKRDVAASIQKPDTLIAFDSDNSNAGKLNYAEPGFSGQFAVGSKLYVIGDDNAFIFIPTFYIIDSDGDEKELEKFYANVDIFVDNGDGYVKLDKALVTGNEYVYTLNDEAIVTVDVYDGEYNFAKPLDKVMISVLPSEEYYKNTENLSAVILEAKVIDAYNIYEAWQLAVIDNSNDLRSTDEYPDWNSINWETFKSQYGLAGIDPAGVVLHNDLKVTYNDVPSSFFHKSDDEVQYRNTVTGEIKVYKETAGMNYLIDGTVLYKRTGSADFTVQGNFFTIDTDDFPLVASPSVFGSESDWGYGGDYSNACLFMFQTTDENWVSRTEFADVPNVVIENLAMRGNAGRDNWVVEKVHGDSVTSATELVTAGGLIMIKSSRHAELTLDNCISNSFFITYFPDYQGHMTVNNSKAYDSYQNGAFVWSDVTLDLNNTYINGTGGPVIIAMSVKEDNIYRSPVITVVGGNIETHVSGEEVWFNAVGATALMPQIKALGAGVNQMINQATSGQLKGNWTDASGKMNILAVLMPKANSAADLTDGMIQGTVSLDGVGVDRWYEATENFNAEWATILQHPAFAQGAPFITVFDQEGNAHTLYLVQDGTGGGTFYDVNNNALGTDPSHQAIIMAFATSDKIVLHQGGMSIIFELYH